RRGVRRQPAKAVRSVGRRLPRSRDRIVLRQRARAEKDGPASAEAVIVLFDGVCNFCSASVQFMIARDPKARLKFAALQSEAGKKLMKEHGMADFSGDPDSIV